MTRIAEVNKKLDTYEWEGDWDGQKIFATFIVHDRGYKGGKHSPILNPITPNSPNWNWNQRLTKMTNL